MEENSTVVRLRQPDDVDDPLTSILRSGARQLLAQAIEMEAEAFLAAMKDQKLPDGRDRVVRHGHGPERTIQTGIDGFRTDTIYDFKDLDVLSATVAITHLYSGFNPNLHVIVRAHESYTDPPAPVIDSINNRQLRQSGGTRYLKVSRTVLDKEKQ